MLEQRETDSNKVVSKKRKNDWSAKLDKTDGQSEIDMRKRNKFGGKRNKFGTDRQLRG